MARPRQSGSTQQTYYLLIRSAVSTPVGQGLTGLAFNTVGFKLGFTRDDAVPVEATLVTQTPAGAWVSGGFCQIDEVNAPGLCRFDAPDALQAPGVSSARIHWTGANAIDDGDEVAFTSFDPLTNPDTTTLTAIKVKTDNLPAAPAATTDIPAATTVAAAVRTNLATELADVASTSTAVGSLATAVTGVPAAVLAAATAAPIASNVMKVNSNNGLVGDGKTTPISEA